MAGLVTAFEAIYVARYGGTTTAPVEVVSYRVAAWGLSDKPELPPLDVAGRSLAAAAIGSRDVVFDGRWMPVPILDRERLPVGEEVAGPAIIEEEGSSTVVPPGWSATLDRIGCVVLRRGEGDVR